MRQDITLLGGFTATANASGLIAANRENGAAEFTMNTGVDINTFTNNQAVSITMANGFNDADKFSGDITIDDIDAGSGALTITNQGGADGSDILRRSNDADVLAGDISLSITVAANATGVIGTSGAAFRIEEMSNLSVLSVGGDVHITDLDVDNAGVTLTSVTTTNDFVFDSDGAVVVTSVNSSGDVRIATTDGSITESANNTTTNIQSTGAVVLSSTTGIGGTGTNALDLNALSVAARTTASGGIYLNEANGIVVSSGTVAGGSATVSGITTASDGEIVLQSGGSTLQLAEALSSGAGNITLSGATLDIDENVSGASLDIDATGALDIAAGSRLIGGGDSTAISVDAASIVANSGTSNSETIRNTGTGSIALTATGGNISLGSHSVELDNASLTVNAGTNQIVVLETSDTREIDADADVTITASAIGSSSNELHINGASSLVLNDTGAGAMFLEEVAQRTILSTTIEVRGANFGSIAIDYDDSDQVNIANGHLITLVDHDETNREFHYIATTGSISVDQVVTGSAAVSLAASAGSISDANSGSALNVTSTAALALDARDGIGSSGNALDISVGQVAATTATGGVFLASTSDLTVGSVGGIDGLTTTTSGTLSVEVTGADLTINESVSSASGEIRFLGVDIAINSNVSGDNIDIDSSGDVTVASGNTVVAGGTGTTLEIDASGSIELGAGTAGSETLQNTGSGTISLGENTSSNIRLSHHSINLATGDLVLNAGTNDIIVLDNGGTEQVGAAGSVTLTAAAIGTLANELHLASVVSLQLNDSGAGSIHLEEVGGNSITSTAIEVGGNNFGSIVIDHNNSDQVIISNGHLLTLVDLDESDRAFSYGALTGNIAVDQVFGGSSAISLTATAGSIGDANSNTAINLNSTGTLALLASSGIGTSGNALDIAVGQVAATTTTGGIFLRGSAAMTVGSAGALNGLTTTSSGEIRVQVAGDNLSINQQINAGSDDVTLIAADMAVSANVQGGSIDVDSTGDVVVSSGNSLIAGGTGTSLEIDATGSISLGAGTSGSHTLQNTGAGTISLGQTTASTISLDRFAISLDTGDLTIDAGTNAITVVEDTSNAEVTAGAGVVIEAASVGTATKGLELQGATSLSITDTGAGGIHVAEINANTIMSTAITVTADGNDSLSVDYNDADTIQINNNHTITSVVHQNSNRTFQYTASSGNASLGTVNTGSADIEVTSASGSIFDAGSDLAADVQTTGTLTLSAASDIGATGLGAIDTNVGTLAAQSTGGDIFIAGVNDLVVGLGANAIEGVSVGTGGDIALEAANTLRVASGFSVLGGGHGTAVTLSATDMTLEAGAINTESVRNTGSGTVTLNTTSTVTLDHHSVGGDTGEIRIDAGSSSILSAQTNGTSEINATGQITLSGSTIGSNIQLIETTGAMSLELIDTGVGEIHVAELGSVTVQSTRITVGNVGFGTVDVYYSNADFVDVDDNHLITSVTHQNGNRSIEYTAVLGNLVIGDSSIATGAGDVTLVASSGQILESAANTTSDISTSGTLTLSAQTGVGTAGVGAIDTTVSSLAAQTTSGGITINEFDALQISSSSLVTGLTASNSAITITAGGDLAINEAVDSGNGRIDLDGNNVSIAATVEGGDIDIDAVGTFDLTATGELIAGGSGTTLSIDATSLSIDDGTALDATLQNAGTGAIALTSTVGDIRFGSHAVSSTSGTITVNSAGLIDESTNSDEVNLTTAGNLVLNAAGSIGAANLSGTGPLDIAAGDLTVQTTLAGGIYLKDTGGLTLRDVDNVSGEVQVESDATIAVVDIDVVGEVTLVSAGDLELSDGAISTGTSTINLIATGRITEATVNAAVKVSTTGTVNLSGASGVGSSATDGAIDIQAGTLISVGGAGDVYVADQDGLVIGDGSTGITTTGGSVVITSGLGTLHNINEISTGAGDITLDASVLNIEGSIAGGSIDLSAANSVTVNAGHQISGGGTTTTVTIDGATIAIGDGSVSASTVENTGAGAISITSDTGAISLGDYAVETDTGDLQINSATAIVESTPSNITSVTSAGTVRLTAAGAIGATGGANISGMGPLDIAVSSLIVNSTSGDGVFLKDVGGVSVSNLTSTTSNVELLSSGTIQVTNIDTSGSVTLVATSGDIELDSLAINASSSNISLTANSGVIVESSDSVAANLTTTGTLTLSAATGIGTTSALDTNVGLLAAETNSGGVNVRQGGGLTIGAGASFSGVSANSGNVQVEATGTLTVNEAVGSNAGNIDLDGVAVFLNASVTGDSVDIAGSGAVNVAAGVQITGGGSGTAVQLSGDSIALAEGTGLGSEAIRNTGTGSITLVSNGTVSLRDHAMATGTGAIAITSTGGTIVESSANTLNKITTGGSLTLVAAGNIGSTTLNEELDINVGALSAQTSGGGVSIREANNLVIGNGATGIETSGGDVSVQLGGNLQTTRAIDAGSGTVTIDGGDFNLDAGIQGGSINLTSSGALDVASGQQILGGGSSTLVTIQAQTISFNGGSIGNESVKNTGTGGVAVTVTTGDFLIADAAIGVDSGDITISATAGAIAESVVGTAIGISTTGTLTLIASTGIGTSATDGEIDTQVGTLAAQTTTGGIYIVEADDLNIGTGFGVSGVAVSSGGDVEIQAGSVSGGDIQVTQAVTAGTGALTLAGANVDLQASLSGTGVDLDASGSLTVASGVQIQSLGTNTSLTVDAQSIQLASGLSGFETVRNTGGGIVSLVTSGGDITFGQHAVAGSTGAMTLDAGTGSIDISNPSGVAELTAGGSLTIQAARVGDATNHLDLSGVTSLTLIDTGPGEFFITELDASTIATTTVTVGDNGFGTITVNYFDGDDLDVGGDHVISLSQATSGRAFDYTAGSGNIRIDDNGIDAGSADVRVRALNGSITELNNSTALNITTSGTLTLSATLGIGVSGQALDTNVGTIAISSTNGGAFINELDDVVIGVGDGLNGMNTAGDVELSAGGTIQIDESIVSTGGSIALSASSLSTSNPSGGAELRATNTVSLAASTIGSATNQIDIAGATSLVIRDQGAGDIFVAEVEANSIANASIALDAGASGEINVDYFNADVIDIDDGNLIQSVQHQNFDRGFSLTAAVGNVLLTDAGINTGTAAVSLTADSGAILEAVDSAAVKLTSQGTVTLSAATGIGSSSTNGTLDLNVAVLSAQTSNGGVFVSEANDLTVSGGGVLSTTSGDVVLSVGGDLLVNQAIRSASGTVTVTSNNATVNADIGGETGVELNAAGNVAVGAGNQISAGTTASFLNINAVQLSVGAGSAGNASIESLGTAAVSVLASGNVTLGEHSIHAVSGNVSLDAGTSDIFVASPSGTAEVTLAGEINLRAATIGSTTNALDFEGATSLVIEDTGSGEMNLAERSA
ncbi:MAG: hypothetical protein AAFV88_20835, partial [Planctomycetota bacterium]